MSVNFPLNIPNNFPQDWVIDTTMSITSTTPYTFWVFLNNPEDQLLADFLAISDPTNARYASYLTYNELQNYTISPSVISAVTADIQKGIPGAIITTLWMGDVLEVVATVAGVASYFQTEFTYWKIPQQTVGYTPPQNIIRMTNPTAPIKVSPLFSKYVQMVTPLNFFPYLPVIQARATAPTVTPLTITPTSTLNHYYGNFTPPSLAETKALGIKQAFYTDLQYGGFGIQDAALFLQNAFGYTQTQVTDFLAGNGALELTESAATYATWQENPYVEANLDLSMLLLMGTNITTLQIGDQGEDLFYEIYNIPDSYTPPSYTSRQTKAMDSTEGFFQQVFSVAQASPDSTLYDLNLPQVISFSYGWMMNFLDPLMLIRINREMMKLGLMGITIIISAGDNGSTLFGRGYGNKDLMSLPAVTSVGYSYLQTINSTTQEWLSNDQTGCYASAFGLSLLFDRKTYMPFADSLVTSYVTQPAVAEIINQINTTQKGIFFSPTGRSFPDIVGLGCNFSNIYVNNQPQSGAGASMAAPLTAGFFSMINYLRRKNDQPFLGHLNPALYANPTAMTPVQGDNTFLQGELSFPYVKGLPYGVAGLGGYNFTNLMKVFIK